MILIIIGILLFIFLLLPEYAKNILAYPVIIDEDLENTLGLITYLLIVIGFLLIVLKDM